MRRVLRCMHCDMQRIAQGFRGGIRCDNPLKNSVIVTRRNYLTDCATFTVTRSEQRGACTVSCSEMPPGACPEHGEGVSMTWRFMVVRCVRHGIRGNTQ
jgi:hypothetical protein